MHRVRASPFIFTLALTILTHSAQAHPSETSAASPPSTSSQSPQATALTYSNSAHPQDPTNAALVYYRIWQVIPEELTTLDIPLEPDWYPDPKAAALLADTNNQRIIKHLLRAAEMQDADWGIEYSDGINALLPHLSKLRFSARLLAADARRVAAANDPVGAAVRIAAISGLATHCANDRTMISSLVSCAIADLACRETEYLLDKANPPATVHPILFAGLDRLPTRDPFGFQSAIAGERYFLDWAETRINASGGMAQLVHICRQSDPTREQESTLNLLQRLNASGLRSAFTKARAYYSELAATWSLPPRQAEPRLAALEQDLADYGIIAELFAPRAAKSYEANQRTLAALTTCRTRLTPPASPTPPSSYTTPTTSSLSSPLATPTASP